MGGPQAVTGEAEVYAGAGTGGAAAPGGSRRGAPRPQPYRCAQGLGLWAVGGGHAVSRYGHTHDALSEAEAILSSEAQVSQGQGSDSQ